MSISQVQQQDESYPVVDASETEANQAQLPIHVRIESLLFVAQEPVTVDRLAAVLEADLNEIEAAIRDLAEEYQFRGFRIQRRQARVQMVTAPEVADLVRRFLGLEFRGRLSPAALETLAMVAYQQPVTRSQIEAIRGVNSDSVLRTLVNHGLVESVGRLEQAGRPILYGTTFEFLQEFGLTDLEQLPALDVPPVDSKTIPVEIRGEA